MGLNFEIDPSSNSVGKGVAPDVNPDPAQFVTVKKNSKKAKELLMGKGADGLMATPVMNLGLGLSLSDEVTFLLRDRNLIVRPNKFQIFQKMGRIELLPLSLAPVLATLCLTGALAESELVSMSIMISLIFLHVGVFSLNDFFGHLDGSDWMNEKGGSRVIQNGWLTAGQVFKLAAACLIGAAICSLPLFLQNPRALLVGLTGLFVVLGAQRRKDFSRRFWFAKELGLFLCLGPLLTASVEFVIYQTVTVPILVVGLAFGFLSGLYVQIRHLISIYVDSELKIFTTAVRFGFDRARSLLLVSIGISCVAVLVVFVSGPAMLFSRFVAAIFAQVPTFTTNGALSFGVFAFCWFFVGAFWISSCLALGTTVKKMKSSFSSTVVLIQAQIYRLILAGAMLMIFASICFYQAMN
jgi:1,4-dihydroxy-2-naphthoate octaprenyltransferase